MVPYFSEVISALTNLDTKHLLAFVRDVRQRDGTLFLCGNGGSHANALHWACDLSKVCKIRTHVLGANGVALTAWANDAGYEDAVTDELSHQARQGDALIAFSCSGTSANIAAALRYARQCSVLFGAFPTALLTGTVNQEIAPADVVVRVWSRDYAVIEDCHAIIGHWLTKELAQ